MLALHVWTLAIVLDLSCGSSAETLPPCEQGSDVFTVRTNDGAATIADVSIHGSGGICSLEPQCDPRAADAGGAGQPCSSIMVIGFTTGVTCTLTLTSLSGATASVSSTLITRGPSYRCDAGGAPSKAAPAEFSPRDIVVDFSAGLPP